MAAAALLLSLTTAADAQSPVQKLTLTPLETLSSLPWQSLASDPKGDGLHPRLPDARELAYAIDARAGRIWFRVTLHDPLPDRWFGMNVALDIDGNPDNGATWWGTNKFKFDRLVSAYLYAGDGYWQGVAGVADADGAGRALFTNVTRDIAVAVDRAAPAILLGVPRSALGGTVSVRVIATVGSMLVNNDDVPDSGAATVTLARQ